MHIKGFGKVLWLKNLSNLCICSSDYFFKFQAKNMKKNKLYSKQGLCLQKKRQLYFLYISF